MKKFIKELERQLKVAFSPMPPARNFLVENINGK